MGDNKTKLLIPYDYTITPAQYVSLPLTTAVSNVTVVAVALQYHTNSRKPMAMVTDVLWL